MATLPVGNIGVADGGTLVLAVLNHPIVLDRFCAECGCETRFVIEFVFANGFFGSCTRCGDERVAAFTRTVGDEVRCATR
jgi:hypothetical protein